MAVKTKKAFAKFPSTCGFVVKRLCNLKTCLKKWRVEFKINRNCFDLDKIGDRTLAYSSAKIPSHFYPGDLVTCTGDWEIRSVSGRLPYYPGELACST